MSGRIYRCFSQCYQEVPLSPWDLWPRKETTLAFSCRNCSGSFPVSLQKSHVGGMELFAQLPYGQKATPRKINVSLSGSESQKLTFHSECVFSWASSGQWGCAGSVLCLRMLFTIAILVAGEICCFEYPGFLQEGIEGQVK